MLFRSGSLLIDHSVNLSFYNSTVKGTSVNQYGAEYNNYMSLDSNSTTADVRSSNLTSARVTACSGETYTGIRRNAVQNISACSRMNFTDTFFGKVSIWITDTSGNLTVSSSNISTLSGHTDTEQLSLYVYGSHVEQMTYGSDTPPTVYAKISNSTIDGTYWYGYSDTTIIDSDFQFPYTIFEQNNDLLRGNGTFTIHQDGLNFNQDTSFTRTYPIILDGNHNSNINLTVKDYNSDIVTSALTDNDGRCELAVRFNSSNYDKQFRIFAYDNLLTRFNLTNQTPLNISYTIVPMMSTESYSPEGTYSINQYSSFCYNISTRCNDGYCGNVSLIIDPHEKPEPEDDKQSLDKQKRVSERDAIGLIIELKDKPLFEEYLEIKEEIDKLEEDASDGFFFSRWLSHYRISKAKNQMQDRLGDSKAMLQAEQEELSEAIEARFASVNITHNHHMLMNAISLRAKEESFDELKAYLETKRGIQLREKVKGIYPIRKRTILLNESLEVISIDDVWQLNDSYGQSVKGYNTTIGIIDTGIDYTHADLGSCEEDSYTDWSSCSKLGGGYDFVNNDTDPMDDQGHGTHCAGIAAGDGTLEGVAPQAVLYAYKVLDSYGSGYDDDIIAAIERSIDPNQDDDPSDHLDVISLSLGGYGAPYEPLAMACTNAMKAGVTVVVAAGNSGPGEETVMCPGCSPDVITVGATYKSKIPQGELNASLFVINDSNKEVSAIPFTNSKTTGGAGTTARLMEANYGTEEDFQALNYSGKVALVKRGLMFDLLLEHAEAAGVSGLIVYNNYPGTFTGSFSEDASIPAVSVSESDGEYLYNMSQTPLTFVKMVVSEETVILADFSSKGPSYMYNKPDIVAPGVEICAARFPGAFSDSTCKDSYHASLSGTSMATPHVTGVSALILQKHPDWDPYQVKAAIELTATDLGLERDEQGSGLVNASAAVSLENPAPVAFIAGIEDVEYR